MLTRRVRSEDGLGLVEAVVAGGLLLIAIVGGIGVFDSSRRESATGELQQVAALQAQSEVERMRDVPYDELAVNPATADLWQSTGAAGDPVNRVEWGQPATFRTGPGTGATEELLFASADGEGIAAQTAVTVPTGDASLDLDVYRFVSWRDEECPVADTAGVTGPLAALADEPASTIDSILAPGSALNALFGPLWSLLNTTVRNRLITADALLDTIDADLSALVAALNGTEEIDPCDADVESLNEVDDTLGPLEPLLTELDSRINAYRAGCTLILCPGTSSTLYTNLNTAITNLENGNFDQALAELTTSLNDVDMSDTTHNTKRVTVAVVPESRAGSGPEKPVWATSVVSDPDAGLLSGP